MNLLRYSDSLVFPALTAVLLSLALPWVGFTFLIWVAFIPLLLFLSNKNVSKTKIYLATASVFFLYMFFAVYPLMHIEGAWWAGTHQLSRYLHENIQFTAGMVIAILWHTVFFLPFVPLTRTLFQKKVGPILVACIWVLLEWSFATFGMWGNSTGVVGYSLVDMPYLSHAAAFGSVYVLSFIVMVTNAVLAIMLLRPHRESNKKFYQTPLFWLCTLLIIIFCLGVVEERLKQNGEKTLTVAVIGSTLSTEASVSEAGYRSYRKKLIIAFLKEPNLILFPENVFPYFEIDERDNSLTKNTFVNFPNRDALYDDLLSLSRLHPSSLLAVGMHTTRERARHNSIVLIEDGEIIGYYNKRALVPFTEFSPLGMRIPLPVDLTAGKINQSFVVGGIISSGLVCSEVANTNIPIGNSLLILAPSNDSVFEGRYAAPMHQVMARMRAIEHNAYLLRANKGGMSSIIGPQGNEIANTTDGVISATLRFAK